MANKLVVSLNSVTKTDICITVVNRSNLVDDITLSMIAMKRNNTPINNTDLYLTDVSNTMATIKLDRLSPAVNVNDVFEIVVSDPLAGDISSDPVYAYERIVLAVTAINYNPVSNNVDTIYIDVKGRVKKSNLDSTNVKVMRSHNSQPFQYVTVANFIINATYTTATLDLTKNPDYALADVYLIQIFEPYHGVDYVSNRVSINLETIFLSNSATFSYVIPEQPGNYKLTTSQLSGEPFVITSDSFPVGPRPDETHSSISIDKPYLVKFSGQSFNINMTLNNAAGDAAEGPYEVVYATSLQP